MDVSDRGRIPAPIVEAYRQGARLIGVHQSWGAQDYLRTPHWLVQCHLLMKISLLAPMSLVT